jgi:hypothetical protein
MKLLILMFLIFLPWSLWAEGLEDVIPLLPDGLVAIATLLVGVGGLIFKIARARGPVAAMLRQLRRGFVTEERIDKAVEELLSGTSLPRGWIDWIGDVAAKLFVGLDAWPNLSRSQRIGIIATIFSELSASFAKKVIPELPEDVMRTKAARRSIAIKLLTVGHPQGTEATIL